MTKKVFASQADLEGKQISFVKLADGTYAYTAEGDEHCIPFDVSRAYDEAGGLDHPRIWTAQRDQEMWQSLEGE